jgi:hypothetical protein
MMKTVFINNSEHLEGFGQHMPIALFSHRTMKFAFLNPFLAPAFIQFVFPNSPEPDSMPD